MAPEQLAEAERLLRSTATVPPDDAEVIRNALQASLGAQTLAAVAPQGLTGLLVTGESLASGPGYSGQRARYPS